MCGDILKIVVAVALIYLCSYKRCLVRTATCEESYAREKLSIYFSRTRRTCRHCYLESPKGTERPQHSSCWRACRCLGEFDRDEQIRCMVITGSGHRAFAAGPDIQQRSDKSPID